MPNRSPSDLPDGYWIGVKNEARRGKKNKHWGFVDNWPLSYTRWTFDINKPGDCAFMTPEGRWDNIDCMTASLKKRCAGPLGRRCSAATLDPWW